MNLLAIRSRLFLRSFLLQAGFSDERRQALGFSWAIDPALREAYVSDPAGLTGARQRQISVFNIQPHAVGVPLGVVAALEGRAAAGDKGSADAAIQIKAALGSALSAAGDAFFWGALRPLACVVAIIAIVTGIAFHLKHPFLAGALVGLTVFNGPALWVRWQGLKIGLDGPDRACSVVSCLPIQRWIRQTRILTMIMILIAVCLGLGTTGFSQLGLFYAAAFVVGITMSHRAGGPLMLVGVAGLLGAAAALAMAVAHR